MIHRKGVIESILDALLRKPGDSLEAKVTKTNRRVLKINRGDEKISITKYENGTTVETRTRKYD
ncbi:MAG: hypothetical protein ILA15_05780 [Clostridiales bacterium]|nr:hypothetical protein [Clostridiales bacterium]